MKSVFFVFLVLISTSTLYYHQMSAYGLYSSDGSYHCDPNHLDLEKIDYKTLVHGINNALNSYQNQFPDASDQQIHDLVYKVTPNGHESSLNLMYKMQECLRSNGIDPDSVVKVSDAVKHAIAVPEFGPLAGMIIVLSIVCVIVVSRNSISINVK